MSTSSDEAYDASLDEYIFHHVILPPKLPQADDFNATYDKQVVHLLLASLQKLRSLDLTTRERDVCANVIDMLEATAQASDDRGEVHAEELLPLLQRISKKGHLLVYVKAQNAALMFSHDKGDVAVEAFELSPPNEVVYSTNGRLRRHFPGACVKIKHATFADNDFQQVLAETIATLSNEVLPDSLPKWLKARDMQEETRDTRHPCAVMHFLMSVVQAAGDTFTLPAIEKHTREEVLWKDTLSPWRRSPFWLMLRVGIQLVFGRSHDEMLQGNQLYKIFMIKFMADFLHRCRDSFTSEMIHVINAKLARRLLKWEDTTKASQSSDRAKWLDNVGKIMECAARCIASRWAGAISRDQPKLGLEHLAMLDFESDSHFNIPDLNKFLRRVSARETTAMARNWSPAATVETFKRDALPRLQASHDGSLAIYNLASFELWVEDNLDCWLNNRISNSGTCGQLLESMLSYFDLAKRHANHDPEMHSMAVLTLAELWVACDKSACRVDPLLLDFKPGLPLELFRSLLLPFKEQMKRLADIEEYLRARNAGALATSPPIFSEFGNPASFAVRYFGTSASQQNLHAAIRNDARQAKLAKIEEFHRKKARYDSLMAQHQNLDHEYYEFVVDDFNDIRKMRHSGRCGKCGIRRQAKNISIDVHEWPIPDGTRGMATVFEANLPPAFAAWREATIFIIQDVLRLDHSEAEPPTAKFLLSEYKDLRPYYRKPASLKSERIAALSAAKPFTATHYSNQEIEFASELSVCKPNGMQYQYYDQDRDRFTKDFVVTNKLVEACTYKLKGTPALEAFLHRPPDQFYGKPHNTVLANQSRCPPDIPLKEYRAWGTAVGGDRLLWLNLLRELAAPNLDWTKSSTRVLVLQLINQAGRARRSAIERESHSILTDVTFGRNLMSRLNDCLNTFRDNWEACDAIASFVHIAARLLSVSVSPPMKDACLLFLQEAQSLTLQWMRMLQCRAFESAKDTERKQFIVAATEAALVCVATFDNGRQSLEASLGDERRLSILVQCSMTIQENRRVLQQSKHPLHLVMLHRWEKLSMLALPLILGEVIENRSTGVSTAVKQTWHEFTATNDWTQHGASGRWLIMRIPIEQGNRQFEVQYDVLGGQLLVDGSPLAHLPTQYLEHPTYPLLFGASSIQIRPSMLPGMHFTTEREFAGHFIHFGMSLNTTDMFVLGRKSIPGQNDDLEIVFVPAQLLVHHLPRAFTEHHVHFYNIKRTMIEFRPASDPWSAIAEWTLVRNGHQWKLQKAGKAGTHLISPGSATGIAIDRILSVLDSTNHQHVWLKTEIDARTSIDTGLIEIELPRLRLSFALTCGSSEIVSRDFCGMHIDPDQVIGSLVGLRSKLVLKSSTTKDDRKIIIPKGRISYAAAGEHIDVHVVDGHRDVAHVYQVDPLLGRLVDKGTVDSKLFICYLHALTSSCCPDPLTQKTGTEQALSILSSAALRSFDTLSEENVALLAKIGRLTPSRVFYPPKLQVMQKVDSNEDLGVLAQHSAFLPAVQAVLDQWRAQRMLYPHIKWDLPNLHSNTFLIERDAIRSSTFRIAGTGAEERTTKRDVLYGGSQRPTQTVRSRRAFQIAAHVFNERQALLSQLDQGLADRLWHRFEDEDGIDGPDHIFEMTELRLNSRWLSDPWAVLRRLWCRLHKSFADSDAAPSKFMMMMWLSLLAFGSNSPMEAISTLTVLFNGRHHMRVSPPVASVFLLSDGVTVDEDVLRSIVEGAGRAIQSCQHLWTMSEDEEECSFKRRRKTDYDSRKLLATVRLVNHLHRQWQDHKPEPCQEEDVLQLIDVPSVMAQVLRRFASWSNNALFKAYLDEIESSLTGLPVEQASMSGRAGSDPFRTTAGCRRFISVRDVFLGSAPLISRCPSDLAQYIYTEKGHDFSTDRVESLIRKVESTANTAYALDYVEQLQQSVKALATRVSTHLSECDMGQIRRELQVHLDCCSTHFQHVHQIIYDAIAGNLSPAAKLVWQANLRPQISSTFLLQQLSREYWGVLSQDWKLALVQYGSALVELQRARRLVNLEDADFCEEIVNVPHSNWDPIRHPQNLLLEVENGIVIRSVQEEIAKEMRTSDGGNQVMQLNMGEGKSSVILPMVINELTTGSQLVRVIVPKPQARQLFQMLSSKLGGLLGRRIYHLPVSRALKFSHLQIEQLEKTCRECMETGGTLLVQPEHLLSLKLLAVDLLSSDKKKKHSAKAQEGHAVLKILHLFHTAARDIVDESDEIFSVKFELVYTMGVQSPIDFAPDRWRVILSVLRMVPDCAWQVKRDLKFGKHIEFEPRGGRRFPRVRFLSSEAGIEVMSILTDRIMSGGFQGFPVARMTSKDRQLLREYISAVKPSEQAIRYVDCAEFRNKYEDTMKKTLQLLRGLIGNGVLMHVFVSKRWRVNFGPDPNRRPATKLAVPYRAKDCPTARSEYSHPDVVITLTAVSHYYAGLSDDELFLTLEHVLQSDQAAPEYAEWMATAPDLPIALRTLHGVNIKDRYQCLTVLFPHLRHAPAVIDYYLTHLVFPKEMREFPNKLSASGWDIGDVKALCMTGFSGTRDSRYLLPLEVKQLDLPSHVHTDALVLSYPLQPETRIELLPAKPNGSSDAEHLLGRVIMASGSIHVILDVGAQILELSNLQVARLWLRKHSFNDAIKAAVYIDDNDEKCVVDRHGHVELLSSSPFSTQMDACLVYLDEAHTRGIDLPLPRDYRAAVTLGAGLTKDRLVQACMRLRKLGYGQAVTFCISPEIHTKITDLKCGDGQALQVEDILHWSISETFADLKRSTPLWAAQGLRHEKHKTVWSDALKDDCYQFSPKAMSKFLEPESQSLEQRYGVLSNAAAKKAHWLAGAIGSQAALQIKSRCVEYEAQHVSSAALLEEQERELSPEIEEESHIERPPQVNAKAHKIHPDVITLVEQGVVTKESPAFLRAWRTLERLTAVKPPGSKVTLFNLARMPRALLVTKDFAETVNGAGDLDSFFRMPQWIVTVPDASGDEMERAIIISPFEAQEQLPAIKEHQVVTLHLYAPRMHKAHKPLDHLNLFTVGRAFRPGSVRPNLIMELNMFSGQTYLSSYKEYEDACEFLRIRSKPEGDEDTAKTALAVSKQQKGAVKKKDDGNLADFMKVFFTKVRRDCEGIDKTHLGKMLYGAILSKEDFEDEVPSASRVATDIGIEVGD